MDARVSFVREGSTSKLVVTFELGDYVIRVAARGIYSEVLITKRPGSGEEEGVFAEVRSEYLYELLRQIAERPDLVPGLVEVLMTSAEFEDWETREKWVRAAALFGIEKTLGELRNTIRSYRGLKRFKREARELGMLSILF